MTTLPVGNGPENIELDLCWYKNFRGCIADFFHIFHVVVLVTIFLKSETIVRQVFCPARTNHHYIIGWMT